MRYSSDKSRRENQSTHFMSSKIFPKIVPIMGKRGKIWCIQTGIRWRCNMAHNLCMLDK